MTSHPVGFFSIPKPFTGADGVAQRNAIRSWSASTSASHTYLFADEPGVGEFCEATGLTHVPDVQTSSHGTPFVSDAFEWMKRNAQERVLCYINSDIVLLDDCSEVASQVASERFLIAGRRWDIDLTQEIDHSEETWGEGLWKEVLTGQGSLHDDGGIDYFLFPKSLDWEMPPLIVGRPGWDNWVLFRARQLHIPVIDATSQIRALHQNHGYSHVPRRRGSRWEGPEGDLNLEVLRGTGRFGLWAATHEMYPTGPRRPWSLLYLWRQANVIPFLHPLLLAPARFLYRLARLVGLKPSRGLGGRPNSDSR